MNHPKTGEQELERLAQESSAEYFGGNSYVYDHVYAFKAGYRAHQSETELLRKRVEKLEVVLDRCWDRFAAFSTATEAYGAPNPKELIKMSNEASGWI